jgi:tetratricopeptide (TPR) repeat protein
MRTPIAPLALLALLGPSHLIGQAADPNREIRRQAIEMDGDGKGTEARAIWQNLIDAATEPGTKAALHRRMAMSWGFEGNCANAIKYHTLVIDYWKTREQAEPQNAFYQQGEMANESARVCIDAGELDQAHRMYELGSELGNKEPEPRTHPKSLWDFRLAHAEARIDARKGKKADAEKHVAEARKALDSDPEMAKNQERFFPYLVGYVALYTGDLATAARKFEEALAIEQNQGDPFVTWLLGMTHEKMGHAEMGQELYEKAFEQAKGNHNPPAAFVRREGRKK